MNINYKKVIIGTIIVGVIFWLVGMVFGNLASDLYMMSPKVFWKPMGSTWMIQMVAYNFLSAFILAVAYAILSPALSVFGSKKGLVFGLIIFAVGSFLGLTMTYLTMAIRTKLICVWALNGLINNILAGLTYQLIDERIK